MALSKEKYVVISNGEVKQTAGDSWREILRRWMVRCPQCAELWLAIGIHESERYVCKHCGHDFAIKNSVDHTNKLAADRGQRERGKR